jgi:hypothetical protein
MQEQLESLHREANRWRAALQSEGRSVGRTARAANGAQTSKKRGAKRKTARRGPSVDWDGVLKRLPKTFTSAQLEKATPALAKNPKARVMALARWSRAKAIKKVGDGKYTRK